MQKKMWNKIPACVKECFLKHADFDFYAMFKLATKATCDISLVAKIFA